MHRVRGHLLTSHPNRPQIRESERRHMKAMQSLSYTTEEVNGAHSGDVTIPHLPYSEVDERGRGNLQPRHMYARDG